MEISISILEMSVRGGVVIAVIAILRSIWLNRVPKSVNIFLWELALLSLMLPFGVIRKPAGYSHSYPADHAAMIESASEIGMFPEGYVSEQDSAGFPVLRAIWLTGAAVLAGYFVISYIKCRKNFRSADSYDSADGFISEWLGRHALRRTVEVRISEAVDSPLTYGIIRPVILLPKKMNIKNKEQLDYILLHELCHIRHFDGLLKLWANGVLCVHWFNPLVWAMRALLFRDIELRCDESVLKELGSDSRRDYAMTVIELSEQRSGFLNIGSGFSRDAAAERIEAIMKYKKRKICIPIIISMAIILAITVVAVSAASAIPGNSSLKELTVDGENAQYLKKGELVIVEIERDLSDEKYYAEDEQIDFCYILNGKEHVFCTTDGCDPTVPPDQKFGKSDSLKAHFNVPEDGEYSFLVTYHGDASFKTGKVEVTKQTAVPKLTKPEAYRMTFPDEDGVSYVKMTPTGINNTYECQSFEFSGRVVFTDEDGKPFRAVAGECDHISFRLDNSAATVFDGEIGFMADGEKVRSAEHDPKNDPEPCHAWGLGYEFDETTEFTPYLESDETAYIKAATLSLGRAVYISAGGDEEDYACATPLESADGLVLGKTVTAQFSEDMTKKSQSRGKDQDRYRFWQ